MSNKNILIIVSLLLLIFIMPVSNALIPEEDMSVFAVTGDTSMSATLNIKISEGTGKIFSSIDESIVGSSTQESVKHAVDSTNLIIGDNIKENYNFTIDISSDAYSIDGPSAGGAMALLMISMFNDYQLPETVSMTGSITSDGYIGDVGGIYYKTKKAADTGIKLFIIPMGNRNQVITEDGEVEQIDLINYAYENWGMKIVEVKKIQDAYNYATMDFEDIDINSNLENNNDNFIPSKIKYSNAIKPMEDLVNDYLKDANTEIENVKKDLNSEEIKDMSILENMLDVIKYAENSLDIAQKYANNNYFYSAANNTFITKINLTTAKVIIDNPSVISKESVAFDILLDKLEKKINLTENRTKICSLDKLEWCIGAKQRITWARNKLNDIQSEEYKASVDGFTKVRDYSYALSWTEIANDFLNIGITDSDLKFVESEYFKDLAQQKIIDIENKLVFTDDSIANQEQFLRRFEAAKVNYSRGWYVTSLYGSLTAMSVITSEEENKKEIFDVSSFEDNYNEYIEKLKSISNLNKKTNIWSKMYLDHAILFYKSYEFYNTTEETKAITNLKTANSILNITINLYDIENKVLDYYNTADIESLIVDIQTTHNNTDDKNISIDTFNKDNSHNVYVYSKDSSNNIYLYLIVAGLFLIVLAVVIEVEKFRKYHTTDGIKKQIAQIDEQLLEGKLSPFTYKELRRKYLNELNNIKTKKGKKSSFIKDPLDDQHLKSNVELKIINTQIDELKKRKKEIEKPINKTSKKSVINKKNSLKSSKKSSSLKKNKNSLSIKKGL